MFRYQILIEYVGTNFRGWQIQKKGKTVQGLVQEKISKLLKEKIALYGAGRLDVGVHAIEQSAHFDCKIKINEHSKFIKSINYFLNKDGITILKIKKRNNNFHARYSAQMRVYKYIIINRMSGLVLEKNRGWHIINELDLDIFINIVCLYQLCLLKILYLYNSLNFFLVSQIFLNYLWLFLPDD